MQDIRWRNPSSIDMMSTLPMRRSLLAPPARSWPYGRWTVESSDRARLVQSLGTFGLAFRHWCGADHDLLPQSFRRTPAVLFRSTPFPPSIHPHHPEPTHSSIVGPEFYARHRYGDRCAANSDGRRSLWHGECSSTRTSAGMSLSLQNG